MKITETYKQLGDLLAELLNDSESLDIRTLCESFITAFTTNKRNNNSKKFSFQISDGDKFFSIDIDMDDSAEVIQSIKAHEDKAL